MFELKRPDNLLHPDWLEARWNITGLYAHRPLVHVLTHLMERWGVLDRLMAFHGCPDCVWNGGRLNNLTPNYPDTQQYYKFLNDRGVGVYLTFSNIVLEAKHLSDPVGNALLECLDESCGLNGVIVVSDVMADYVRRKKPGLILISSIVKSFVENPEGRAKWYREMESRFDRVVVHTDHMFDRRLMDKLDRDKAEILLTEGCGYKCPHRAQHQTMQSVANAAGDVGARPNIEAFKKANCPGGADFMSSGRNPHRNRLVYLSHEEVKTIYDMGFRLFKISGRRLAIYSAAWNVIYLMFNPDLSYVPADLIHQLLYKKLADEFDKVRRELRPPPVRTVSLQGRGAAVLEILRGRKTAQQVALEQGTGVDAVQAWVDRFVRAGEQELSAPAPGAPVYL